MALRLARNTRQHFNRFVAVCQVRYGHGDPGSGAGMGGGSGGSIRDAGGAFGKMEQAHEDQYFRSLQEHQFKELKEHHDDEIEYHTEAISRHREKITRLEKRMENIDNQPKEG